MNALTDWHGKPYYSLDAYCKNTFHRKCYKIALDAHMTCPNRDGTLGSRGCIFCSKGGSGEFAVSTAGKSIEQQLSEGLSLFRKNFPAAGLPHEGPSSKDFSSGETSFAPCFIAYFQAYTNTYAPVKYLESIFSQALASPFVSGISIATRPDCLPPSVLSLLVNLKERFPDKFIWIELGLQTIHEDSAKYIRRGYELPCFTEAFEKLKRLSVPVIVHTILGLPGETKDDMYETIRFLNRLCPFGIKLQLLHVLRDTDLAAAYERGEFRILSKEEYLEILIHCLELLRPETVVHRVTGDGPRSLTLAPQWSLNKRDVLNSLHRQMKEQGAFQGRLFLPELLQKTTF